MACKINWTGKAWDSYENNIDYLLAEWTEKEVIHFVEAVDRKLTLLTKYPQLGSPKSAKQSNVRCTLIHKRVVLLYKHNLLKNEIDL